MAVFDNVILNGQMLEVCDNAGRAETERVNQVVIGLGETVNGLSGTVDDLSDGMTGVNGRVDNVEDDVTRIDGDIDILEGNIDNLDAKVDAIDTGYRFKKVRIYFEDTAGKANAANEIQKMLGLSSANCVKIPCRNCAIGTTASDTYFAAVINTEFPTYPGGVVVVDDTVTDVIILCGYPDVNSDDIATGATELIAIVNTCYPNAFLHCVGVDWAATSSNRQRLALVYSRFRQNLNGIKCVYFDEYRGLINKSALEANDAMTASAGTNVGRYVGNKLLGGRGCESEFGSVADANLSNIFVQGYGRDSFMFVHNAHKYELPSGSILAPDTDITLATLNIDPLCAGSGRVIVGVTPIYIDPADSDAFMAVGQIAYNKVGSDVVLVLYLWSKSGYTQTLIGAADVYIPSLKSPILLPQL